MTLFAITLAVLAAPAAAFGLSKLIQREAGLWTHANSYRQPEAGREMTTWDLCDGSTRRAQGSTALR